MSYQDTQVRGEALTVAAPIATMMSPVIANGHLQNKNK